MGEAEFTSPGCLLYSRRPLSDKDLALAHDLAKAEARVGRNYDVNTLDKLQERSAARRHARTQRLVRALLHYSRVQLPPALPPAQRDGAPRALSLRR